jgi:hypothetical protein
MPFRQTALKVEVASFSNNVSTCVSVNMVSYQRRLEPALCILMVKGLNLHVSCFKTCVPRPASRSRVHIEKLIVSTGHEIPHMWRLNIDRDM